jgi:excisionase family DNA binding protein
MPDLRKGIKATRIVRFSILTGWSAMRLVEILESRKQALRVSEVATLFAVTSQHIYKMTAKGMIPSLRIAGAIRFDPQDLVNWLKAQRTNRSTEVRRAC